MANHASAIKRHRQSEKRNARNRAVRSQLSSQVKKARLEIAQGNAQANAGEVRNAVSLLAKTASKGVLHKKTVARKTSRLMKQANK